MVNRVLSRCLSTEDPEPRRELLKVYFSEKSEEDKPKLMAEAIVGLAKEAQGQKDQAGALGRIREVALDVGVVASEVCGEEVQEQFMEDIQPLFDLLSAPFQPPGGVRFVARPHMEKLEENESGRWPELHGGPEGQYHKEATGRWRSLSQPSAPRRSSTDGGSAVDTTVDPEVMAFQKAARHVKLETGKLWDAAQRRLDSKTFENLKRQEELERAQAEVAFEKARLEATWAMLRQSADRQALAEIAQRASGGVTGTGWKLRSTD
eukprot:g691.t1